MKGIVLLMLVLCSAVSAERIPQAQDRTVQVFAIGSWAGDFAVDAAGRGGLAALHTLRKNTLQLLAPASGTVLLFYTGRFTAAKFLPEFEAAIRLPQPGLMNYMKFDSGAFSSEEISWTIPGKTQTVRRPMVDVGRRFDFERAGLRIASLDVRIAPDASPKDLADAVGHVEKELEGSRQLTFLFFPDGRASEFLRARIISNIHSPIDHNGHFFFEPGKEDTFYRDPTGPFYCRISGRHVCSVTMKFRNQIRIGLDQKFINLNGADEPAQFLKPDPVLMDTFRR